MFNLDDIFKMLRGLGNGAGEVPENGAVGALPALKAVANVEPVGGNPLANLFGDNPLTRKEGVPALGGLLHFENDDDRKSFASGLAKFGASLSESSAPSLTPQSLLSNIGKAIGDGREDSDNWHDDKSKREFMAAQRTQMANNANPAYVAEKAMAQNGMVKGDSGSYDYVPGYREALERADAAKAAREDARDQRRFDHQMDVIEAREEARTARDAVKPMSASDKKAIREAQENVSNLDLGISALEKAAALNGTRDKDGKFIPGKVMSGTGVETRMWANRNLPFGDYVADDEKTLATSEYDNLVRKQGYSTMKAIFGSNPTEGERAALDSLQASLEKSPEERDQLLQNNLADLRARRQFQQDQLADYGVGAPGAGAPAAAPAAGGAVRVTSPDEAARLPADVEFFITPDGRTKRNPNFRKG